jgi:hypothetical protein
MHRAAHPENQASDLVKGPFGRPIASDPSCRRDLKQFLDWPQGSVHALHGGRNPSLPRIVRE